MGDFVELIDVSEDPQAPIGKALAAAAGAAVLGAIGWALLLSKASYEIGWLAWGIGGLIGWVAVKAGGRGATLAIAAAVLSVLSISAGKLLGYHLQIGADIEAFADQEAMAYDEYMRDAAAWSELCATGEPAPEAVRGFMSSHEYADPDPEQIPAEDLDAFLTSTAPRLEGLQSTQPSPEEFRAGTVAEVRTLMFAESSLPELVIDDLSAYDALFVFLGVSTAFSLVMRAGAGPSGKSARRERAV